MLIVTGDRDTFQLIDDHVTVLYNSRGVSDMKRYDPASPAGEVRADPGPVPGLRRAARRPERQPAVHPRRGGEDRDQVDRRVRLAREPGQPGRRGQGQGRRRAARATSATCCATASSPRSSATCRRRRSAPPRPTWRPRRGTATRSTSSSTPSSSACCATASTRPSPTACPARPPWRGGRRRRGRRRRAGGGLRGRRFRPRPRAGRRLAGEASVGRTDPGLALDGHLGPWHRAGRPPSRSPPPTARARSSTRPR